MRGAADDDADHHADTNGNSDSDTCSDPQPFGSSDSDGYGCGDSLSIFNPDTAGDFNPDRCGDTHTNACRSQRGWLYTRRHAWESSLAVAHSSGRDSGEALAAVELFAPAHAHASKVSGCVAEP